MLTTSRVFSFSERALRGSVDLSDVNLLCSQHVCMRPLSVVMFCTFLWSSDPLDAWMPTLIQSQKNAVRNVKHVLSLSCIFGSFGVLDRFLILVGALVGAVSRYCHFWYRLFGPLQHRQIFVRCVLVNTLQYNDTVDFVQDSETEDPQLVAEPGVGRKHDKTMETRSSTSLQKNWQGRWPLRQLKGESRIAAEVVMDDALVQDDGIDLIVDELDRCWEVTQDQEKDRKCPLRDTKGRHNGNDFHVLCGKEEA